MYSGSARNPDVVGELLVQYLQAFDVPGHGMFISCLMSLILSSKNAIFPRRNVEWGESGSNDASQCICNVFLAAPKAIWSKLVSDIEANVNNGA